MSKGSDRPPISTSNAISGDVSGVVLQVGTVSGNVYVRQPSDSERRLVVPLPHRVGVVPARANAFQDRDSAREMSRTLANGESVVLAGLGGVGKTQVAVDYVDRAWAAGDVDLLVWVTAGSREAIVSTYADAFARLTGSEDADPERGARRMLEWLAVTGHRWIMVLDDVRNPADVAGLWPPTTPVGRVIITTRRRDATLRASRRRFTAIGVFDAEEALAYLQSVLADRPELLDGAAELVRTLGFLPLALAQAVAYLRDRELTCEQYRHRFADRARLLNTLPSAWQLADGLGRTVSAARSLSVEWANQLSPLAGSLLELVSVLSAEGVPEEVFLTEAVFGFLEPVSGSVTDREAVLDGLRSLHRLSLITLDRKSSLREVRAHTLVQRATRGSLPPARLAEVVGVAAEGLWQVWSDLDGDDAVASVLRASVSTLRQADENALWQRGVHHVLLLAGTSLAASGQLAQARDYLLGLVVESDRRLGPDHPDTLKVRGLFETSRGDAGDPSGAVAGFEVLLADHRRVLGPHDSAILDVQYELAKWRGEAGDPSGAVAGFEALLADSVRVLGADHPNTLAARHNLAHWRGAAGAVRAAVAEFEQLVSSYERVLGPDHPETLAARHNLAHWRGNAGDVNGALTGFEQLLLRRQRVLGWDHPDTLATRLSVADWRGAAGDATGALTTLEELLRDQRRVLGPDHIATLGTRFNLAQWRSELGFATEAIDTLQELHSDLLRVLGPEHPNVFVAASSLANALRRAGKYRPAAELDEVTLTGRTRVLGPDHPDTLRAAMNLAADCRHLGRYERAQVLDRAALVGRERLLGPEHHDTLHAAMNLAVDLRQLGDHESALALDERALAGGWDDFDDRLANSVELQRQFGVLRVYLVVDFDDSGSLEGDVVEAFWAAGVVVRDARASVLPGGSHSDSVEDGVSSADAVVALITESAVSSSWFRRDIESALRRDALLIPVYFGVSRDQAMLRLSHGLASRLGVEVDSGSAAEIDRLVYAVLGAITARKDAPLSESAGVEDDLEFVRLADITDMVHNAFAAADRRLRAADGLPQLLEPGPVWIAAGVEPTAGELDRFADHLEHGRLGYLVHVGELRGDAQVTLDQLRISGKPVVTVSVRSLRAAHADNRVDAFLTELERDYGNRDNLFDTKNALINERFLFGRDVLLNTIGSALRRNEHILVTGMRKVGKTSLLNILRQHLVDRPVCQVDLQRFNRHHEDWPPVLFALMLKAFDRWGRAEHDAWPFEPSKPSTTTELEDELDRRQAHLKTIGRQSTTLVVVLDELERIFPVRGEEHATRQWVRASGALRALAQGDRRHVVVVGADLRPIVNRENDLGPSGTNPFFAFFQEMPVTMLERADVDDMIRSLARAMGVDVVAEDLLTELFRLTGGHPSLVRTLAAEAYRRRVQQFELTAADLDTALAHLDDTDAVGFFLRNNLWQLMTTAEQEVVRALALGRPLPEFVTRAEERQARAALRSQGLISDEVRIELFRAWLQDVES